MESDLHEHIAITLRDNPGLCRPEVIRLMSLARDTAGETVSEALDTMSRKGVIERQGERLFVRVST